MYEKMTCFIIKPVHVTCLSTSSTSSVILLATFSWIVNSESRYSVMLSKNHFVFSSDLYDTFRSWYWISYRYALIVTVMLVPVDLISCRKQSKQLVYWQFSKMRCGFKILQVHMPGMLDDAKCLGSHEQPF